MISHVDSTDRKLSSIKNYSEKTVYCFYSKEKPKVGNRTILQTKTKRGKIKKNYSSLK